MSGSIKDCTLLNNGVQMPMMGVGTYQIVDPVEVERSVLYAIDAGYRSIDTASFYENEEAIGNALKNIGIPREELFITTKIWNSEQGYDETFVAFDRSLRKLKLHYIDLYLIHWPVKGLYVETWRAMEELMQKGRVKAIGVSNFMEHHIDELIEYSHVPPVVNQIEFHPLLQQKELVDYCTKKDIKVQAWRPLMNGKVADIPLLIEIGARYNKSPYQVTLKWNLQRGILTIPKSTHKDRLISNADIFDFDLSNIEIEQINELAENKRLGAHPDFFG